MTLSLAQVSRLCVLLRMEPFALLAGWDVQGLVDSPDICIARMNLEGLHDLCSHLGLNRIEALPEPVAV